MGNFSYLCMLLVCKTTQQGIEKQCTKYIKCNQKTKKY